MLGNLCEVKCVMEIEDSEKNMYTNVFFSHSHSIFLLRQNNIFHTIFSVFHQTHLAFGSVCFIHSFVDGKFSVSAKLFKMVLLFRMMFFLLSIRARERNLCSLSNLHFLSKSYRFHNNKHASSEYIHTQPHIHTQSWHIHENWASRKWCSRCRHHVSTTNRNDGFYACGK